MACPSKLGVCRGGLRLLGIIVSIAFATQCIWHATNFSELVSGPLTFCHWIGDLLLFVFVGATGVYMEVNGMLDNFAVSKAVRRILKTILYFWIGCYIVGMNRSRVRRANDEEVVVELNYGPQEILAITTGIVAWILAAADLITSFMCEARTEITDPCEKECDPEAPGQTEEIVGSSDSEGRLPSLLTSSVPATATEKAASRTE
eukprot:TRINITY_DN875_c0_g1_i2.p1 TRINITY_DN875_c0_g1~~TRINITY_DN875_c0_g1_i2.p1  ORF type:complete len:227 (-),score=35.41 TRINITY_DN875_c0_g1_i2:23-634(-)